MSGGELQRIALARVFLRDPQILIMDEPAAHLDPKLQVFLEDSIQQLMIGRTSVMIAHRLSSVLKADEVIFMQAGRIMVHGNHLQLLSDSTPYREFILGEGSAT
jgi:ATP-binding cassette subfamily B protein AbcA/BmrA